MSTRSQIGIKRKDGSVSAIYCHHDGYISYVGEMLLQHYTDRSKVDRLIKLGNLSSLGKTIGRKHDFHAKTREACTAYGRDRGEDDTGADKFDTIENYRKESEGSYTYLYDAGTWYVTCSMHGSDWGWLTIPEYRVKAAGLR